MSEEKNILDESSSRLDTAEERISELEYIAKETIQSETEKKSDKKNEQSTTELWGNFKQPPICIIGALKEEKQTKKNLKTIV